MPKPITITPYTPIEQLPQFLTVEGWRTLMRIGRSTAYDLIRQGLLPAIRWGRTVRIPREAMVQYVNRERARQNSDATPGSEPEGASNLARRTTREWRYMNMIMIPQIIAPSKALKSSTKSTLVSLGQAGIQSHLWRSLITAVIQRGGQAHA